MECAHPVVLKRGDGVRFEVPCGGCTLCRTGRARDWAVRCVHEASYWKDSAFFTLTYRDDCLPALGSLDQAEFTKFWKRLRKSLGKRIRYFACGEYGERYWRPHYHALAFGLSPCTCAKHTRPDMLCSCPDRCLVMKAWGLGGVPRLGSVTYDSARYTADYIGKGVLLGVPWDDGREASFQVMSQGVGRRWIQDNAVQVLANMGLTVNGDRVGLPRYYVGKLRAALEGTGFTFEEVLETIDLERVRSRERRRWLGKMPLDLLDVEVLREQRELEAQRRLALRKKGIA